jgi:hypothetical protein
MIQLQIFNSKFVVLSICFKETSKCPPQIVWLGSILVVKELSRPVLVVNSLRRFCTRACWNTPKRPGDEQITFSSDVDDDGHPKFTEVTFQRPHPPLASIRMSLHHHHHHHQPRWAIHQRMTTNRDYRGNRTISSARY